MPVPRFGYRPCWTFVPAPVLFRLSLDRFNFSRGNNPASSNARLHLLFPDNPKKQSGVPHVYPRSCSLRATNKSRYVTIGGSISRFVRP